MPIIKYPEYSVEIVVKEGTGEITTANFSATVDPMSTSNMVLMKKKNRNLKPFIWGVSKWSDGDYNYMQNTYKGISTIGSGKNAEITLTFSQPVDHFTLYFDDVARSMPLSLTIGSQTFTSDDYQFTYSQETYQATYVVKVNKINEVNGVEMPLMIVGVENRIALDITHKTGLQHLRAGHTYTKDKGKPAYGIISQEGALDIFDFYTEIDDLIELGLLDNKMDVSVKFQDNVVGKYTSNKWTENQTNLFQVSLNDTLIKWQTENMIPSGANVRFDKDAYELLFEFTYQFGGGNLWFVDETTIQHLHDIKIKYFFWDWMTRWQAFQKLCNLAQLYIYNNNYGVAIAISQKRIDELKAEKFENPIIIPYTLIDGTPKIDRLTNNKIEKVTVIEQNLSEEYGSIVDDNIILKVSGTNPNYGGYYEVQTSPIQNMQLVMDEYEDQRLRFIHEVSFNDFVVNTEDNPAGTQKAICSFEYNNPTMNWQYSPEIHQLALTKDEFDIAEFDEFPNIEVIELLNNSTIKTRCYAFNIPLPSPTIPIPPSTDVPGLYLIRVQLIVNGNKYVIEKRQLIFGNEFSTKNYQIPSNEFIQKYTKIDEIPIAEYNANNILENFTGKQNVSFRMATDSLKYKNGNLAYDINLGQTPKELDIIQLQKTDGTYDPKIWQISKVEHEAGGSNWLNIEAVEI